MALNEFPSDFAEPRGKSDGPLHIHIMHRHVPVFVSYLALTFLFAFAAVIVYIVSQEPTNPVQVILNNATDQRIEFSYGSWPALQNADFFQQVKDDFIAKSVSFIEADLTGMKIKYYGEGKLLKEVAIISKGREGSWWETPAGLYQVQSKEENHFSSFGRVFMPWSLQFQGNFFIHGPTTYPDGTPTPPGYSGGCVRVGLADAEELYRLVTKGAPVLVFKNPATGAAQEVKYEERQLLPDGVSYLAADLENNFVFAGKDATYERAIASITKLMSALVAVEYINVEREVVVNSSSIASTSIPRLHAGEISSVLDLLSLMLLESSNEAANAVTAPVGHERFLQLMNTKAKAIGMAHSHFADTSGVLWENTSTVEDLFALAKYLYYNRSFILHMTMGKENRAVYDAPKYKNLQNLNLIPGVSGMVGGKMGISQAAKDSMFSVFELNLNEAKRPVAIIVLGSDDAKRDTKTLLDYIRNNFSVEVGE